MTAAYIWQHSPEMIHISLFLSGGLLTMVDFPPNLEDGHQWLPSDIYQEIISGTFKPEAVVDNITQEYDADVRKESIKSSFKFSSEIESFEHGSTRVLKEQNCLFPVHMNGNGRDLKGFVGNSGGTGVFLPQTALRESKPIKGTGVFLQYFSANAPTAIHKETSGKNGHGIEKMLNAKETPKKRELSQLSSELCLPPKWSY